MKIRIKSASLRLRLSQPEVAALVRDGEISETTPFPDGTLRYMLRRGAGLSAIDASFRDGIILVTIPETHIAGWESDDRIGFRAEIPLSGGFSLAVLIEKDFQCLDDTDEDQSLNYPNPKAC